MVSISITFFNKILLSRYNFNFPALLLLLQHLLTIALLQCAKTVNLVTYNKVDLTKMKEVIAIIGNVIAVVVANCTIIFIECWICVVRFSQFEHSYVFGVKTLCDAVLYDWRIIVPQEEIIHQVAAVSYVDRLWCSVGRSVMDELDRSFNSFEGAGDLTFGFAGYLFALMSTLVQAAYLLYVAKSGAEKGLNTFGLLFYNSLLAIPFVVVVIFISNEMYEVQNYLYTWTLDFQVCMPDTASLLRYYSALFVGEFAVGHSAQLFDIFVYYSEFSTHHNDSWYASYFDLMLLGNLKNLLSVVLGLLFLDPPPTTMINMLGLTLNAAGGVWYSVIKYYEQEQHKYSLPTASPQPLKEKS